MTQRYSKYKDSGIEWIGEIPEHWEVRKVKEVAKLFGRIGFRGYNTSDLVSKGDGAITISPSNILEWKMIFENNSYLSWEKYNESPEIQIENNDILIVKTGSTIGKVGIVKELKDKATINPQLLVVKNITINKDYFFRYFKTEMFFYLIRSNAIGSTIPTISESKIFNLPVILPPLPEQEAIAQFLDEKCARIDEAVRIKEKQIDLLKEYRQIAIHQAVTKGLNDQVEMKDSGIDWIGEIPEHWEVKRLKFICYLKSGESINAEDFVDDGYPVFGGNGFRGFANTFTNCGRHILIGRQGALCGNVNYADGKFFASEHAIVVYLLNNEEITWLGETIRIANFNRLSQSAAQPGISVYVIKNVSFPYPPKNEQQKISEFIESLTTKTDEAIRLKEQQIEQLKQYKTSLINDVVTGKVRVA